MLNPNTSVAAGSHVVSGRAVRGAQETRILDTAEWTADATRSPRLVRADLMTRLPGRAFPETDVLRRPLNVSESW